MAHSRRLKVGILSNEFFDLSVGRMGGFGWATRQVANCFNGSKELCVDVVLLCGERQTEEGTQDRRVHDTRLIYRSRNTMEYFRKIRSERLDLILSIDYRDKYRHVFRLLPRTPIIVWVRDPRPPEDAERIRSIRIPGAADVQPQGVNSPDCTSLAGVVRASKCWRRPVLFATPAPFLADKVPGTYGVKPPEVALLPNIIDIEPGRIEKSPKPTVAFLARLDPYKRPWLFSELARHFPDVRFLFLGQAHFRGEGAWEPGDLPHNVEVLGHVDGERKVEILSQAWALVNTSAHEGLAVSFQEALRCETPLLSCVDPQGVVSRYGIFVGHQDGTGMEAMPRFVEGLTRLLEDAELRRRLGKEGASWVRDTHSKSRFLESFFQLAARAGVARLVAA